MLHRLRVWLRALFARDDVERDMNEEMRFHLQRAAERLRDRGMSEAEAFAEARREFGNIACLQEESRDARGVRWIQDVLHDVGLSLTAKALLRRPGFTATVVVTLALGIGANTAIYSVVDAIILHPIAVDHPDRIFAIFESTPLTQFGASSVDSYRMFAGGSPGADGIAAELATSLYFGGSEDGEDMVASFVSDDYFKLLGVRPAAGRLFAGDPSDGSKSVAVISGATWKAHFAADPAVIGRVVSIGGQRATIIGVADERFHGTSLSYQPAVWLPLSTIGAFHLELFSNILTTATGMRVLNLVGRVAQRRTLDEVGAELATVARRAGATAANAVTVLPIDQAAAPVRNRYDLVRFLGLLFTVVALALLMAALNLANLFIVRAGERSRELGIRMALGASRMRLAVHVASEGMLLSLVGGALGLAFALVTIKTLPAFTLPGGVSMDQVTFRLDKRVLAFAGLVTMATAMIFALAPAIRASRSTVLDVLRPHDGRSPANGGRRAILALQVAISLVLLVGAALFVRSLRIGLETDIGFDPWPLAAVRLQPSFAGSESDRVARYMRVLSAVSMINGVTSAAAASHIPLAPFRPLPLLPGTASPRASHNNRTVMAPIVAVTGSYFEVVGVPLVAGRSFGPQDDATAERVAVVNESAAKLLSPGERPLGQHFNFINYRTYTVVGVVRDTKYATLQDQGVPFVYAPMSQEETRAIVNFVVRTRSPRATLPLLVQAIHRGAPELKTIRPRLISDQVAAALATQRLGAELLSAFALLTLCVSAVGIYGTVSYVVSQRTKEIGIRRALGARPADIVRLVVAETAASVAWESLSAFSPRYSRPVSSVISSLGSRPPTVHRTSLGSASSSRCRSPRCCSRRGAPCASTQHAPLEPRIEDRHATSGNRRSFHLASQRRRDRRGGTASERGYCQPFARRSLAERADSNLPDACSANEGR